jgi:hypothetical protein
MESINSEISFISEIQRFEGIRGHYISIPTEYTPLLSKAENLRLTCSINQGEPFHCSPRPKGDGTLYISLGAEVRRKGKLAAGVKVTAVLHRDESVYGRPMPEELRELLEIDPEGKRLFHQLNPGGQRGILYYIQQSPKTQTRIDRAIKMIDRLKIKG